MSKLKVKVRAKVLIPLKNIDPYDVELIKDKATWHQYLDPFACKKCEYNREKPNECGGCEFYKKHKFFETTTSKGKPYLLLRRGLLPQLQNFYRDDLDVVDCQTYIPMKEQRYKFDMSMLNPKQVVAVEDIMSALSEGRSGYLKSPPRTGKCVVGSTYLFTDGGMRTIQSVVDLYKATTEYKSKNLSISLSTLNGMETTSHGHIRKAKTIKLITHLGYEIEGTAEHPIYVLGDDLKYRWKTLAEFSLGDRLIVNPGTNIWSSVDYSLPKNECLDTVTVPLAKILGYLIANGSLSLAHRTNSKRISFCTNNTLAQKDFITNWNIVFGKIYKLDSSNWVDERTVQTVYISNVQCIRLLELFGLNMVKSASKSIPECILQSTKPVIASYLNAYLTCDSYFPCKGEAQLCTASSLMATQLHLILLNIGIVCRKTRYHMKAHNSESDVLREYHSIFLNGLSRNKLLAFTGNLLKCANHINSAKPHSDSDRVPHVLSYLYNTIGKHYSYSGYYEFPKNGKVRIRMSGVPLHNKSICLSNTIARSTLTRIDLDKWKDYYPKTCSKLETLQSETYYHDEVVSVLPNNKLVPVYDLTVPGSHSFTSNGMISHNTVMLAAVVLGLKLRTIIFAHQEDLLIGKGQLLTTFTEPTAKNAPINPGRYFTNLHKFIEKGRTPIKFCRTLEDFLTTDICLTTYQVFLHPRGKKMLEQIKDKFGLLACDEFHRTGAEGYSHILDQFTCPRLGLSATPKRKDNRHRISFSVFGDKPLHETSIESLAPVMSVVKTGFTSNKNYKNWVYMLRFLEKQDRRIESLLRFAYTDVKTRGRSILIPVAHHSMVDMLVENLNDRSIKAIGWDGRLKKKDRHIPLQMSANRDVDVIVAQRSMLTGINIPVWDTLYWFVPMNNPPNFEQEYKRICTPMPGKPQPVVRFFVDNFDVVERCFFNCAEVIYKQGGTFTPAALEHWVKLGSKFNKITNAKRAKILGEGVKSESTIKKKKDRILKSAPVNGIFDNHDIELVEDDEKPKAKKPKKTSHLSRKL